MLSEKNIGSLVKFVDVSGKEHVGNIDFVESEFNTLHIVVNSEKGEYGQGGISFSEVEVLKERAMSDDEFAHYLELNSKIEKLQNDWNSDLIDDEDYFEEVDPLETMLSEYVQDMFLNY